MMNVRARRARSLAFVTLGFWLTCILTYTVAGESPIFGILLPGAVFCVPFDAPTQWQEWVHFVLFLFVVPIWIVLYAVFSAMRRAESTLWAIIAYVAIGAFFVFNWALMMQATRY